MPKQKTIKIVDVEPPQEGQPDEQPEEQQEVVPSIEEVKETPPKAKSKARAKSKVRDTTLVVAKDVELDFDTKDEPTIKAIEKIECPNCNKMVSAKTFKYSHVHTCKAKKEVVEKPVAIEEQQAVRTPTMESLETVELKPVILSSREARLQKRQEHLNQLIKQAF